MNSTLKRETREDGRTEILKKHPTKQEVARTEGHWASYWKGSPRACVSATTKGPGSLTQTGIPLGNAVNDIVIAVYGAGWVPDLPGITVSYRNVSPLCCTRGTGIT